MRQVFDIWKNLVNRRFAKRALVSVGYCVLAASCGGTQQQIPGNTANEAPATSAASSVVDGAGQDSVGENVTITFSSEPDPLKAGDNTFQVRVTRPDGSPVTDAAVSAVFSMPAMPSMNMPAMRSEVTLPHRGAGVYRGSGQLSMGGTWNVAVTASRGSEELGTKRFSVIAK